MIYDILSQEESSWSLLLGGGIVLLFISLKVFSIFKKPNTSDKLRNLAIASAIWSVICIGGYLSNEHGNGELNNLKKLFNSGQFETVHGMVRFLTTEEDEKSKLDIFQIGKDKIIRISPNRAVPMKGCWKGFITENKELKNRVVKIDFINFPKWDSLPYRLGGEKIDQPCILRVELVK